MNLRQLNRLLTQTLFLPVVGLVLIAITLGWQFLASRPLLETLHATDQVIDNARMVRSLTANESTGVRNYQRTLKETDLQPYEFAMEPLVADLNLLRTQMAAQNEDMEPINDLIDLHDDWTDKVANPVIHAARSGYALNDPHTSYVDHTDIDKMEAIEAGILTRLHDTRKDLSDRWEHRVTRTAEMIVPGALLCALVLGVFASNRAHLVSDAYHNTMEALRSTAQATYESEQRLRATLTSIGEGVVVCDDDGRIELLNTAAQRLSGWTQAAASHRHMELVFPLIDELTNEPVGPTQFTTAAQRNTVDMAPRSALLVRSDGSEFFVERGESPIYDRAGSLTGSVTVISDVTERRRTQAALLASEKLAVAGRLAATIAHEIHNPLDSVVNLLYMLKQGTTLEEREEFVDMAQSEIARVTNISRAMLGMHRESRTPILLDIAAIMHSVLILLERSIAKGGIQVVTSLQPESFASGYPAELRQVFTNLLTNAADASASGTTITVSVYNQTATLRPGDELATIPGVIVKVADQGSGIRPEIRDDLFRPFFTTKGEQGSGLGLWITKGIIEKHAGTIEVESSVATPEAPDEHGTTFTLFLPRGTAQPPTNSDTRPATVAAESPALITAAPASVSIAAENTRRSRVTPPPPAQIPAP